MSDFLIARSGRQYGPYSAAKIQAGFNRKQIHPTDLCWTEGMTEWKPVSAVFQYQPAPPPPPSPGAPPLPKRPPVPSAPAARVEDAGRPQDDTLAADPNTLAARRGLDWWEKGWRLFRKAAGLWIGIGFVGLIFGIFGAIVFVILGPDDPDEAVGLFVLLVFPIYPVLVAGLMLGCHSLDSGGELTFNHLFAGFRNDFGRLLAIGALLLPGLIVLAAVSDEFLVIFLLSIPLHMFSYFAPALVVLHGLTSLEAVKLSFRGCLHNILPFLLYELVNFVLGFLLGFALPEHGWLVLITVWFPVFICSLYVSYRDIFTSGRYP